MSPLPSNPQKVGEVRKPEPESPVADPKPTVIMTEVDSYVHERMRGQPQSIDEVRSDEGSQEQTVSRLQLPRELEPYSYDCSRGADCRAHQRDPKSGKVGHHGEFVFRWTWKEKRSIDYAMNVRGWVFVNRTHFPDLPRYLFSSTGGIEVGDSILMFMSVKKALALRVAAGQKSLEMIRSRMSPTKKPGEVIMTGEPDSPQYYMPDAPAEVGGEGTDQVGPTAIQQGRDFD